MNLAVHPHLQRCPAEGPGLRVRAPAQRSLRPPPSPREDSPVLSCSAPWFLWGARSPLSHSEPSVWPCPRLHEPRPCHSARTLPLWLRPPECKVVSPGQAVQHCPAPCLRTPQLSSAGPEGLGTMAGVGLLLHHVCPPSPSPHLCVGPRERGVLPAAPSSEPPQPQPSRGPPPLCALTVDVRVCTRRCPCQPMATSPLEH